MFQKRPLVNIDFIDNLSLQDMSFLDDKAALLAFTRTITGLDDRRTKVEKIVAGEDADGKGDKKGGKGDKKGKK